MNARRSGGENLRYFRGERVYIVVKHLAMVLRAQPCLARGAQHSFTRDLVARHDLRREGKGRFRWRIPDAGAYDRKGVAFHIRNRQCGDMRAPEITQQFPTLDPAKRFAHGVHRVNIRPRAQKLRGAGFQAVKVEALDRVLGEG